MEGGDAVRATFEIDPPEAAEAVARQLTTAMAGGPAWAEGRVVDAGDRRAVIELPAALVEGNLPALVASVVAGEATEVGSLRRLRLVGLAVPDGFLPGPALGAAGPAGVGVIVKPSVGLSPRQVADVAAAAVAGGATWLKDDEVLADPPWCPLAERVTLVARRLQPGVTYCANVTGPYEGLMTRARRAVDLGATGVMVAAAAQGMDAVGALRRAELGVPVLAHRAGSGPWARNQHFGPTGAVLTRLFRLAGADAVIVGAFGGKLFETESEVEANLAAARDPMVGVRPSTALLGGGLGPPDVVGQVARAGGSGVVALLGSAAYDSPGGLERAVADAVASLP